MYVTSYDLIFFIHLNAPLAPSTLHTWFPHTFTTTPIKMKDYFLIFFQSLTYCTYFINPFGKIGKKYFDFFRTSGNSVIGFRIRTNQHEETGCCSMLATCCYTVQSRRAGHDAITVATIRHNFQTIQFSPILVRIESRPYTFHKIYSTFCEA